MVAGHRKVSHFVDRTSLPRSILHEDFMAACNVPPVLKRDEFEGVSLPWPEVLRRESHLDPSERGCSVRARRPRDTDRARARRHT